MADTKIVVNCETGEVQEIELTAEEIAERQAHAAAHEAQKAEEEATAALKAEARQLILKRLGLTEDEAKLLLS